MENNACYHPIGPRDEQNRGDFALIDLQDETYGSIAIEIYRHRGSGIYEHETTTICSPDEVSEFLK